MAAQEVASLTLFKDLSEPQASALASESYCATFPSGMTLFWQNTPVKHLHVILSGHVSLTTYHAGHEHNVLMPGQGCAFPLAALAGEGAALTTARTVTTCRIASTPIELVRSLMEQNHAFALALLRQSVTLSKVLIEESHVRSLRKPYERIAVWIRQNMNLSADGQTAPLPYPKLTLAAALGMSPATFAREADKLMAHGIVFERDRVHVSSLAALDRIAQARPEVVH
ncbi:MAG: cyclic nucleotide-binding domain-containing protein [Alsobacter sp.]